VEPNPQNNRPVARNLSRILKSGTGAYSEIYLEGGFEVFDDFLSQDIGVGEIVGFFEAFVCEPEDVEASLVAVL
jgi:hypothetical protein